VMAVTNVILDYLLIFGHGGFPQMGIKGAAIASVIAEAVSIVFFLVYTRLTVDIRKYALNQIRSFDFGLLRRVLGISIFTMLQYFAAMTTWFMFFVAVERLGQRELAIANIVRSVYIVLLIPVNALSTTTNTFVSNAIGAGHKEQVIPLITKIARLSFCIVGVFVLLVCLMPEAILSIYTNDTTLIDSSVTSVYVISLAMLVSAVSNVVFSGVSGTGNTRSALWIEGVTLIFYALYVYVVGMRMHEPVAVCFTVEALYYAGLLLLSVIYLKKGTWQNKKI
jgi:Na+-driven multidrug efflux pump